MVFKNKIVVSSRTFSGKPELVQLLQEHFNTVILNTKEVFNRESLVSFISDAEGLIVGLESIDDYVLAHCPKLKIVSKYGVGLDSIDTEACKKHDVTLGWTGGVNKLSVAEMTLGFMVALSRNLFQTSLELKRGLWNKDGGLNLSGHIIGIIGVGNVGKEVIRLLAPFNCKILVNDILPQDEYYRSVGVEFVEKEELFSRADIVSLHIPLNEETRHTVNKESIALMRRGTYIVNTARGPLVDHYALEEAIRTKHIAGVALDVYDTEPPLHTTLLSLENVFCTPHIGGNSKESVLAMGESAVRHLITYFSK